jgi:hypothetical protein
MSETREMGKAIKKVAKRNGIPMTWKVTKGDLVLAVEDANHFEMIGILNKMGFVGIADVHPDHGWRSIWIKDEVKANVVEIIEVES